MNIQELVLYFHTNNKEYPKTINTNRVEEYVDIFSDFGHFNFEKIQA